MGHSINKKNTTTSDFGCLRPNRDVRDTLQIVAAANPKDLHADFRTLSLPMKLAILNSTNTFDGT